MSTREQVRQEMRRHGITMTAWAQANGVTADQVRDVLRGKARGDRGAAHVIAVKLGIKDGVITEPAAFPPAKA